MKKIKITLRSDGTQEIEVEGASGEECLELTRELEKRLGRSQGERTLKPEFHEAEGEANLELMTVESVAHQDTYALFEL